jgi:hypothetical protein
MKSLLTEEEKLRIRSMHINEKYSLLKEEGEFFDLDPLDVSAAKPAEQPAQGTTGGDTLGQSEVKAFQDWLDVNKVDWDPTNPKTNWKKLNKGKGYGINGPRTKAAWAKFMGEYNKSKTA